MTTEEMNFFLGKFVLEAQQKDGQPYSHVHTAFAVPHYIVFKFYSYFRKCCINNDWSLRIANSESTLRTYKNLLFSEVRQILDARIKQLLSEGVGTSLKQAEPIPAEDEEILWEKGVFGRTSAIALQHTVWFYACKLFALRGHDEHRSLQCEQFEVGEDLGGKFINFIGRANETFKGGLRQLEVPNKRIKQYCQSGERCIADLMGEYLAALGRKGEFYRKPLPELPIRYGIQPVGINTLKGMMKAICAKGGLRGKWEFLKPYTQKNVMLHVTEKLTE